MPAPLYVKFRSLNSVPYFYDACTAEICHLGEFAYAVLDNWGTLAEDDIVKLHSELLPESVRDTLKNFREIQRHGILQEHTFRSASQASGVFYRNNTYDISDFLSRHHLALILEVTENCNLRCEYCPYGQFYISPRKHSECGMNWDTARKAIDQFLKQAKVFSEQYPDTEYTIAFYGGEPMLEMDIIKKTVEHIKIMSAEKSDCFKFGITTNGTLLTDESIHFFAEHSFHVTISMDGDREIHDRHRVFDLEKMELIKKGRGPL
jgi:uncharacterized protein